MAPAEYNLTLVKDLELLLHLFGVDPGLLRELGVGLVHPRLGEGLLDGVAQHVDQVGNEDAVGALFEIEHQDIPLSHYM